MYNFRIGILKKKSEFFSYFFWKIPILKKRVWSQGSLHDSGYPERQMLILLSKEAALTLLFGWWCGCGATPSLEAFLNGFHRALSPLSILSTLLPPTPTTQKRVGCCHLVFCLFWCFCAWWFTCLHNSHLSFFYILLSVCILQCLGFRRMKAENHRSNQPNDTTTFRNRVIHLPQQRVLTTFLIPIATSQGVT